MQNLTTSELEQINAGHPIITFGNKIVEWAGRLQIASDFADGLKEAAGDINSGRYH